MPKTPPKQAKVAKTRIDEMFEPGTYVCLWNGQLLRVQDDAIIPGRPPAFSIVGKETLYVTKISDDPNLPLAQARVLASQLDVQLTF
jgi:hypothetical protein